jgi:hypothetical protein
MPRELRRRLSLGIAIGKDLDRSRPGTFPGIVDLAQAQQVTLDGVLIGLLPLLAPGIWVPAPRESDSKASP